MGLLNNLVSAQDKSINNEKDTVGASYGPLESGLYPVTIDIAYVEKKKSGALFLNVVLKTDNGQEHKEGLCVTSGDAKGNKSYYEKNGERFFLPGFNHANALGLLAVGKELQEMDTETKTIKLYNYEAQKELNTDVEMVTDLVGERVIVGLQKQIVDKNQQADDGSYQPTGETRETNEIDKVFREKDHMTVAEILAQEDEAAFYATWDKKNTGITRNKAKGAVNDANGGVAAATSGAPAAQGGGGAAQRGSLFK
jgi:hypothetical protein